MTLAEHGLFLASVALACFVQNLTGFAFGLVVLGLATLTQVAPLPVLTHVVSILVLVNAASLFLKARPQYPPGVMAPTLVASQIGVVVGAGLILLLSQRWLPYLQGLLALTILVASADLLIRPTPAATLASKRRFAGFGLVSGLLGGLFSTAGPPLVYHFYRQPLALERIRDALVTVFAVNALLRLALFGTSGQLNLQVLWLSLEALPLVWGITHLMAGKPPPASPATVRKLVCLLLVVVALSLGASAWHGAR